MLSYTTIGVNDIRRSTDFYERLLQALGLIQKFSDDNWAGWRHPTANRPLFIITRPFDSKSAAVGNGHMIAFLAESRVQVDQCYRLALEHGGTDEGKPGLRPDYHPDYYGAYFRDPDGNKLCVCCHHAQ